ncbi:MAG: MFS transporter [Deltaproteobacteria bacterium]|jgi:FSR family fosmidomycin resistance protein-like MFS transporter|nr:MFS transporter [Deltaproteobacteria bacterium]MBW2488771.1 MFS transporter [Deltaproteobacteria bacterium]
MVDSTSRAYWKILIPLSLVHFSGDFYSSFISPLFPVFIDKIGLSLAQVGFLAGISRFLMFIVQPMSGYWADRRPSRSFILIGLLMPILFIPLAGMATSFYGLLFCIVIGSTGSSLFHPPVTGMVPQYAGRNLGLAMSIYNTSGTLAFGVGPIFITWYVAQFGLRAMPMTMVIGLSIWIYFYWAIPRPKGDEMAQYGFLETLRQTLGNVWQPILLIWIVMVMRALVGQSLLTFMPVLWVQKGHTIVSAGVLFSIFTISGTAAGILCGHLSDRMGYKRLLWITHGLMTPFLLMFLLIPGKWIYPATILAGGFNMATLPLGVVMAQKIAPKGRSMVASLMMGLAFGTGGILSPIVGKLADIFTIQNVLIVLVCVPVFSLIPIYFIPEVGKQTSEKP